MSWRPQDSKSPKAPAPKTTSDRAQSSLTKAELEILRQKTADLVGKDPEKAAAILSSWINQAARRKKAS